MFAIGLVVDGQLRGRSNLLVAIFLLSLFVWAAGKVRPRWLQEGPLPYLGTISFSVYLLACHEPTPHKPQAHGDALPRWVDALIEQQPPESRLVRRDATNLAGPNQQLRRPPSIRAFAGA
jgi:hypothetical protein